MQGRCRRLPARGVRLIEGATGATRWRAAMTAALNDAKDRVAEVIAAPDLDGDGVREIVMVSEFGDRERRWRRMWMHFREETDGGCGRGM